MTPSATTASNRMDNGSRPSASAPITSSAPRHERTVGTSAPVNSVYPTAAAAPATAAINGNRTRSASHGDSASRRIASTQAIPTTALTCSPLTESRCVNPASRIA